MTSKVSIFSWHNTPLLEPEKTCQFLIKHKITHIYQMVSPKESSNNIRKFLQVAKQYGLTIYFLMGEAEWALDPKAKEAVRIVDGLGDYKASIKGIVLDIEPYTLAEFKHHPKRVMESFVRALESIYLKARQQNLEVIVCLPYYFDTMGFTAEIKQIVNQFSDSVAVMNYYRDKEIDHIATEARLAQVYGKSIFNIYELQPPNTHGLTDQNTYYNKGLEAVYKNFKQLKEAYPLVDLHLSFHEMVYFIKLAEKRKESK